MGTSIAEPSRPMRIQLLGGFSVSNATRAVPEDQWRSKRARNLVKLLALSPGHRLHRDQIIDILWPDSDPAAAANNFHQTLYSARKVLDAVARGMLTLDDGFLTFGKTAQPVTVDVDEFESAAKSASEAHDPAALQHAVSLYTGDLLPGDLYEDWASPRRDGLRQTYLQLLLMLAGACEANGDTADAVKALQHVLAMDKSHEAAQCGLMRLYAMSGRSQQALRQYQALRDAMRSELDAEPGAAAQQLFAAIQSGRYPSEVTATPPVRADLPGANQPTRKLPVPLTSFIGRETEIAAVCQLLEKNRLVTLTGSGGTGKTRLGLEIASRLQASFPDGCCLVELAAITDPDTVPQAVASTLGLQRIRDISYQALLVHYLRDKKFLLVLDNCEHLLDACASLAGDLLENCPPLILLATSREALGLMGEVSYRVPSLLAPDSKDLAIDVVGKIEAVRLFADRAWAVLPGFELTPQNLVAAAQVCHRLDGIPLAIELAAARVIVLSVEQIAARLDDRFLLLTGGSRTALPRQRTLHASIEWSYSMLSEPERLLMQRLSVFSGGWTLEAAEHVCSFDEALRSTEILDGLASLVNKSLVIADYSAGSGIRYRVLETIRQFAQEKHGEMKNGLQARNSHLSYFLAFAEECGPLLRGERVITILDQLDPELDNLRGAITWALGQRSPEGAEKAVRIINALQDFWMTRALASDIMGWTETALPLLTGTDSQILLLRAKALFAPALLMAVYTLHTKWELGLEYLDESIRLFRQVNNLQGEALSLCLKCQLLKALDDPEVQEMHKTDAAHRDDTMKLVDECLILMKQLVISPEADSRWTYATIVFWMHWEWGHLWQLLPPDALNMADKVFTELHDIPGSINLLIVQAGRVQSPEEIEAILLKLENALPVARRLKSKFTLGYLTFACSAMMHQLGRYREMSDYSLAARVHFREAGTVWMEIFLVRMGALGLYHAAELTPARALFLESLAMSISVGDTYGITSCLVFLAGICWKSGSISSAIKVLGCVDKRMEGFFKVMDNWDQVEYDRLIDEVKQTTDAEEFNVLWQQGRVMSQDETLVEAKAEPAKLNV